VSKRRKSLRLIRFHFITKRGMLQGCLHEDL